MKKIATGALIAAWFLALSWRGLVRDFTEDDLMNMYFAWILPAKRLILANLTPFTSVYRPVGSAFYRVMYLSAGLHPLPFRIAAYALMLLNLWLVYRVVVAVTGTFQTGALAALIFSFHKRLFGLFVNGGTIYDLLCATFCLLAIWWYVAAGTRGWRLIAFWGLFTLALNSKEMAAALPAILLVYELIYRRDPFGWKWIWDRRAIWISAATVAIAFKMKTGQGSSFFGVHDYDRIFSVDRYFATMAPLVSQLFYLREDTLGRVAAVAVIAGFFVIAILAHNRAMILGAAILTIAPLPVNFIAYRGFFVMYIPMIGFALWASAGLTAATRNRAFPVVMIATAALIYAVERRDHAWNFNIHDVNQDRIRAMRLQLEKLHVRRGGRVLLVHQPFDPDNYDALFLVRLLYGDPAITVDTRPGAEPYDLVVE
jgi:hypothetical protein